MSEGLRTWGKGGGNDGKKASGKEANSGMEEIQKFLWGYVECLGGNIYWRLIKKKWILSP